MENNQTSHSCNTEKCCQIRNWVSAFLQTPSEVFVGEYSYNTDNGTSKTKSVICIMNLLPQAGIFCVDKSIDEIQPTDIVMLYKALNQAEAAS